MAPAASVASTQDNQLSSGIAPAANGQVNYKNLLAGGLARGVAFSALALAVAPFILTAPVHAADDNTVSIDVDQNAVLKPSGTLYKATTNVTVKTGKPYGFNLTMQADTADLINSKDQTHKISATPSSTPVALNANQWGYSLNKSATTFSAVPAVQATPAVVADVTKAKPAGCTDPVNCTKSVTFAANVDPAKLASGSYSTAIIYTATTKPAPKPVDWQQRTAKTAPSDICRSGDNNSSCLVDLDKNMIPVKYTGMTTTSVANPEDANNQGEWYNYSNKMWANAVTVKNPDKYKGEEKAVDKSDVLGYWVYIPRYTYEVMRRDITDLPVKGQNFDIEFENTKTPKKRPTKCTYKQKDYRSRDCYSSREIPSYGGDGSTWATHPAFTFGENELNGIWVAKFKITGTVSRPTVLPYESHISGNTDGINNEVGNFYSLAKSFGVIDKGNVGGGISSFPSNTHKLAKLSSRMVNNNDWGAIAYLAASKYGAGYNDLRLDGNTTDNSTGIEGMMSGDGEYVAASYTENTPQSYSDRYFRVAAREPYVNTYYNFKDMKDCKFNTCGGQALYEVDGWGGGYTWFVGYYMRDPCTMYHYDKDCTLERVYVPWFKRGGRVKIYQNTVIGLFSAFRENGSVGSDDAFRVTLGDFRQD